jgi:23S rRNA (uracil1939-C5)-methyltransferase
MGRRSKVKFKVFESVRLESAVAEGNCIARVDGQALFVKYGAPGDLVDVQVFQKKKNYMEGRLLVLTRFVSILRFVVVVNGNICLTVNS